MFGSLKLEVDRNRWEVQLKWCVDLKNDLHNNILEENN